MEGSSVLIDLLTKCWPPLAMIGLGFAYILGAEIIDWVSPGNGWMTMAYLTAAGGVSFIGYAFWSTR